MTPFELLTDLTARSFTVRLDGEKLIVSPASLLTEADRASIKEHRDGLLILAGSIEDAVQTFRNIIGVVFSPAWPAKLVERWLTDTKDHYIAPSVWLKAQEVKTDAV